MSQIWRINKWYGGLSTGSKRGVDGAFAFGQGLDFKTDPDLLQANYALVKDSSTTVADLIKWFARNGTTTYAYGNGGKIYSKASGGAWTLLRTVASSSGQGLAVFNDYLYYTQNAQLGRYGPLSGAAAFTDNYQTLNTDTLWHPLKVYLNKLCVGNGRSLATLDNSATWTASFFQIPIDWKLKCFEVKGDFLYMGSWKGIAITDNEIGGLFSWDGTAATYNSVEYINESGVNALVNENDTLYIAAGTKGNLYEYAGGKFFKIKRIPSIGVGKTAEIYPGAMTGFNGYLHLGTAGSTTSTTLNQGIYTWSQAEKNYPVVLNFDYPISTGTTTGTSLAIGSVFGASPTELYVGWQDNSTYGIDLLSTSTPQSTVINESLIYDGNKPYTNKQWKELRLYYEPFVASESISVKYKANRAANYTTLTDVANAFESTSYSRFLINDNTGFVRSNEIQIRLELNSGAKLIEAVVIYDEEEY